METRHMFLEFKSEDFRIRRMAVPVNETLLHYLTQLNALRASLVISLPSGVPLLDTSFRVMWEHEEAEYELVYDVVTAKCRIHKGRWVTEPYGTDELYLEASDALFEFWPK
jgi:hypothetical protein